MSEFDRIILDVCNAFKDVTGAEAEAKREGSAIMHWVRNHHWETYDFRLIMEFCTSDVKEKVYFSQPGKMNIRSMFHPARGDVLLDMHSDLKRMKEILEKQKSKSEVIPRASKILLKCGAKIFREDFDRHNDECFAAKGKCFYSTVATRTEVLHKSP